MATNYIPLTSGFPASVSVQGDGAGLASFVNTAFTITIGLVGILAVLMIIWGGVQYVSTDAWSGKEDGKKKIQAALGGLILALSTYLILNTIDPNLTKLTFEVKPVELREAAGVIVVDGQAGDPDYDLNESIHLDPSGGAVATEGPTVETSLDEGCQGLSDYRAGGYVAAKDKDNEVGSVSPSIAWLMQAVPKKWPGLQVYSGYRGLKRNLMSAYGASESTANAVIAELARTDGSYAARVGIAAKYGLKKAALTSLHVRGLAVDFGGPGLSTGQADELQAWAKADPCRIGFGEILWRSPGHTNHIHLGVRN